MSNWPYTDWEERRRANRLHNWLILLFIGYLVLLGWWTSRGGVLVPAGTDTYRLIDTVTVVRFDWPRSTNVWALVSADGIEWQGYDATSYSPPIVVVDGTNPSTSYGFVCASNASVRTEIVTNSVHGIALVGRSALLVNTNPPPIP